MGTVNYYRNLTHILKDMWTNRDYNRFCNITWKKPEQMNWRLFICDLTYYFISLECPLGNCEMSEVANVRKKCEQTSPKICQKEQLGTKPSPQFHFPPCSSWCAQNTFQNFWILPNSQCLISISYGYGRACIWKDLNNSNHYTKVEEGDSIYEIHYEHSK